MTPALWHALIGAAVLCLSLYHLLVARDLLRRIIAVNLLGTGLFIVLVALGYRGPDAPPDPVPQALVLTGIVVAVSATGLALALARRVRASAERPEEV